MKIPASVSRLWRTFEKILPAVLLILAGLCFLIFPEGALHILLRTVGVALLLYVILTVALLLMRGMRGMLFAVEVLVCVFFFAVSMVLLIAPGEALAFAGFITGLFLAADSAMHIYREIMFRFPRRNAMGWITFALYIVTMIVGIWLMVHPGGAVRVTSLLLGIALLIEGAERLLLFAVIRLRRPQAPPHGEYIEGTFTDKSDGDDGENG